jgi:hypothetical protein
MGMLGRHAVRLCFKEVPQWATIPNRELRLIAKDVRIAGHAVDVISDIAAEQVEAGSRSLVGMDDGAAIEEAPFGNADRAVDAAGAGGRNGKDASLARIEVARDLDHQGHAVLMATAAFDFKVGQVLHAGDQAPGHFRPEIRGSIRLRTPQDAHAAGGYRIDDAPVIVVDGKAAQLRGCGRAGYRRRARGGPLQPFQIKSGRQQIVVDPVVLGSLNAVLDDEWRQRVVVRESRTGDKRHSRCYRRPDVLWHELPPFQVWGGTHRG